MHQLKDYHATAPPHNLDPRMTGGNFNCNIFLCDDGDCGDTCAVVEGRDQVEVAPDSGENMLSESMRAKWRDSWGRKQMRQEMSCTGG